MIDDAAWMRWAEKYSRRKDSQRVLCLLQHWNESVLQAFFTQHVGPNVPHVCWIYFTKPCGKRAWRKHLVWGGGWGVVEGPLEEKLEHWLDEIIQRKSLFSPSVGFVHIFISSAWIILLGRPVYAPRWLCNNCRRGNTVSMRECNLSIWLKCLRFDPPSLSEQQSQEMTGFGGLTTCKSLWIIRRVWIFHFVFYRRISDYPGWRGCQIDRLGDCRHSAVINSCSTCTW